MVTTQIKIQGMACSGCVNHIQKALIEHTGVTKAEVDLPTGMASIEHQNLEISSLNRVIQDAGYSVI